MTKAAITVSDRFFEVAAAQSSAYPRLWTITKETIQNSQDAGASRIEFVTREDWICINDNGPGMRGTGGIANFLTIGASEANESGSTVGFFSTAKVRICFIHADWRIRTNDQFLEKSMLGENIQEGLGEHAGCHIEVQSRNGDWDSDDIRNYVDLCNPELDVYINGCKASKSFRKGTLKAEFRWGTIYVNRGEKAFLGQLVVRVNGLAMYTSYLPNVKAQVTVELDLYKSHLVLQENREGLVWAAKMEDDSYAYPKRELDEFISSLIVNPHSVKETVKTVIELVCGEQRSQQRPRDNDLVSDQTPSAHSHELTQRGFSGVISALSLQEAVAAVVDGDLQLKDYIPDSYGKIEKSALSNMSLWIDGEEATEYEFPFWLHADDFFEIVPPTKPRLMPWLSEEQEEEFFEIFPWDYVLVYDEGTKPKVRVKHARVMRAWKEITEIIAGAVGISTNYGVGMSLKQDEKASWVESDDGDFLIIDFHEIKTTAKQLPTVMRLTRLACHELTHAHGWYDHNESFIIEESEIYEAALERLKEIRSVAKGLTVQSRQYW